MERVGPPMIIQPPYSLELLLSMCSRKVRRWVEGRLYRWRVGKVETVSLPHTGTAKLPRSCRLHLL